MNIMVKIDLKDRKILLELQKNSRLSASRIGKRVGLSWDVVNYRIKRLEREKVITGYNITVNIYKLGKRYFKIHMRFSHISDEKYNEILSFLNENHEVKWVASTDGSFDMIIGVIAESIFEFENFKNTILSNFGDVIASKVITTMISYKTYGKNYLLPKSRSKEIVSGVAFEEHEQIDGKDQKIISSLAQNSTASVVDIAKKTGLTPKIVRYHMSSLGKRGIIVKYGISINKERLGYRYFKCFIGLDNTSPKRKKELEAYIDFHPNITYITYVIGEWELEVEYEVENVKMFYRMLYELRTRFHDIISTVDTVIIFKEQKLSFV